MSQWISVKDQLPEPEVPVLVFTPRRGDEPMTIDFDFIDPDSDGAVWYLHNKNYEHYLAVAPPESSGPSEEAPYTHWCPIPDPPLEAPR